MSVAVKTVGNRRLLYVMAVEAEYGPHLGARIAPFMTGVGPVEAAVQLTLALCRLEAEGDLPDLVVSLGSAGSATLEQTQVYQATSVSYRDMDASALGFTRGATPFLDLPAEVPLPFSIPGIAGARLSTGANVVSGAAYGNIDADMVEMETYAALRACQAFGIPLVSLRGISDGKAELSHIGDWTECLHVIDEKLAAAVERLEAAVADGTLAARG
jgi:adenosylhomocysteine nucleosidase